MSDIAVGVDIASELDRTVISQRPEIDIKPLAAAIMDMAERDKGLTMMGLEELIEDYLYQPIDMGALPQATHVVVPDLEKSQQTAMAEALYKAADEAENGCQKRLAPGEINRKIFGFL